MLKRLRGKIIGINMALVGVVLLCVFAALVTGSYQAAREELERGLSMAAEAGGERFFNRIGGRDIPAGEREAFVASVVALADESGAILETTEHGATIDADVLAEAVERALSADTGDFGELKELSLAYARSRTPKGTRIAFASSRTLSDTLKESVLRSLALFALSLMGLFGISIWLSGYAVRPIETAWSQQKRFVADASHELKTPLTVILANLNILAAHPEDSISEQRKWLESTDEEAKHMRALIDQMLLLSKSEDERASVVLSDVNASDMTEEHLLFFEPLAYEKGAKLKGCVEPGVTIRSDPVMFKQILQILIDNAIKYSPDGGEVTVALAKRGSGLSLSVNNAGEPISPEQLPRVFDRFYRLDSARGEGGYGLGLAIAKSLCERLGGSIAAASDAKRGTTFTVNL